MTRAEHFYFGHKAMVIIETVKSISMFREEQHIDALPKGQN